MNTANTPESLSPLPCRGLAEPPSDDESWKPLEGPSPDVYPLSKQQERLWLLEQLKPLCTSGEGNAAVAIRLHGHLDCSQLEIAVNEVIKRHQPLHSRVDVRDETPLHVVDASANMSISISEVSPNDASAQSLQRAVDNEANNVFVLRDRPAFVARLIRVASTDHVLVLTAHPLVADLHSMRIVLGEVLSSYSGGKLPVMRATYADYVEWQRKRLSGERLQGLLDFWTKRLEGAPAAHELPTDRPRPAAQSFRIANLSIVMPGSLTMSLRRLAGATDSDLFTLFLSALGVVVGRWSGQADLVFGVPSAGRGCKWFASAVGSFENALVLRMDMAGDPSFRELIGRTHRTASEASVHAELPFATLVQALDPPRDMSRSPVFQIVVDAVQWAPSNQNILGVRLEEFSSESRSSRFDLHLQLNESADDARAWLRIGYAMDIFDEQTIVQMSEHLITLLRHAAAEPDRPVSALPMVGAEELSRRSVRPVNSPRNELAEAIGTSNSLTVCFTKQAELQPDATAIMAEEGSWTYAALHREAGRIAALLIAERGEKSEPIGLLFAHEPIMVAAVLGVLGAGKIFVPLSPEDPPERIRSILAESGCECLLVGPGLKAQAESLAPALSILDAESTPVGPAKLRLRSPGAIAYVLFTTGTTGTPKGVAQCDGNFLRHMSTYVEATTLHAEDRMAMLAAYGFDQAIKIMFGTLLSGATLCLWDVRRKGIDGLQLWMIRTGVTMWHTTASLLRTATSVFPSPTDLRWLILGGEEAMPHDFALVRRWCGPSCRLLVGMSGTECSTALQYVADPDRDLNSNKLPVGKPVEQTEILLLDPAGQMTDLRGEIAIASSRVALGYWRRPGLTAERFIPDPRGSGGRLYRTGDLGRWRSDGNLEFLGRVDHQVKIRGYRIELGEIEAALLLHTKVSHAVAVAFQDESGEKRLAAYIVPKDGNFDVTTASLTAHLREILSDYKLPTAYVVLKELPLTTMGKLDRKALPEPVLRPEEDGYTEPSTLVEKALASIWAEVLRLKRVGIDDNFFALGGHSLLAMRAMARMREQFPVEVSLRALLERPTIREIAATIESPDSDKLADEKSPLVTQPRFGNPPMSYAQERLWFLDRLQPGGSEYNMAWSSRLRGSLDIVALGRAFETLVTRHEVLRTRFTSLDNEEVQVIDLPSAFSLEFQDLSDLDEGKREEEASRRFHSRSLQPFDLEHGPLLRVLMVRLAEDEYSILVAMHHIVSDGWSMAVLRREVATLYNAYSQGRVSPLPALPVQYADYALWQREWLQGEVLDRQLAYWKNQLSGMPAALELPTDRPRPALQSFRGARVPFLVEPRLAAALLELGRARGATLYMVLLAAFQVFLSRWSGQRNVVVGSPIAGRTQRETEGLIGFFVNTLVLRTDLSDDPGFNDLVSRVKSTALDAYAHQDVPFEKLVAELQPERDLSRQPLFQVLFALQNVPQSALDLDGIHLTPLEPGRRTAKFDLFMQFSEQAEGLAGSIEYATDLFEPATIERMAGHFVRLLESVVQAPCARCSELDWLGDDVRATLCSWNKTQAPWPADATLPQLFEHQVERTPEAVALIFDDKELTYAQLNTRANRLAHRLRGLGVGPEVIVAVCAERSLEMVIALLAILKAGGAYVPLDPNYPSERLAYMLDDARPAVLLTQSGFLDTVAPSDGPPSICLDTCWQELAPLDTNPSRTSSPENMAYLIYTSGSTGHPKGVAVAHTAIVNRLHWMQQAYGLTSHDRVLQKTPFSFDVSVWEFFWPLLEGATLLMARPGGHQDAQYLAGLMSSQRITTLHFVPPMLEVLLPYLRADELPSLRQVICSGEALPWELQQRFFRLLPSVLLHNLYGPTEAAVDVTAWQCRYDGAQGLVPIGKPISNIQIHIVDTALNPVPIGVPGELCIAGVGLARGYLRRPALTADRFVPNPNADSPAERMYRTGDLARWLPDGSIEYMRRIDQQVKIRGMRIELGEIEAQLAVLPEVREVVVLAREDEPGDKRLVAYVVPQGATELDTAALRARLQCHLPDYMIPAHYIVMAVLPLTLNGKLDRRALPAPDERQGQTGYLAPRTPIEIAMAAIWAQVLRVEQVGIHDDFFDLGGHSLLTVSLIQAVNQDLHLTLPLSTVFTHPTLGTFSQVVEALSPVSESLVVPFFPERAGVKALFCLHPVGGEIAFYRPLAEQLQGRFNVYGVQSPEAARQAYRFNSLQAMAFAYANAVVSVQPEGPYRLLGWSTGGQVALVVAKTLEKQGHCVEYVGLVDSVSILQPSTDHDTLGMLAAVAVLSAVRGANLPPEKLSVTELWMSSLRSGASGPLLSEHTSANVLLEDLAGQPMTSGLRGYLQRQLENSWHHLSLLHKDVGTAEPTKIKPHIYLADGAEHSSSPPEVSARDRAHGHLFGDSASLLHLIPGSTHYSILKSPHVKTLAAAVMASFDQKDGSA